MKNFSTHVALSRRLRTLFLIAMMSVLAACSTIRLSYNHGDTLLYWWLNAYVDFEGEQSSATRQDIRELFQWHRKTQLNDYATMLGGFQRQLAANPSEADLLAAYHQLQQRAEVLALRMAPDLADLARTLTPAQIKQMEARFAKKNDEYRRKYISGSVEQRQRARFDKSMDQFKLWFGSFTKEQESALRLASDARGLDGQLWLDERIYRQRKILALARRIQQDKPSKEASRALITALLQEFLQRPQAPERKAFYDAYTHSTISYLLTSIQIATPAQKDHAQKRMQGWIDDFKQLAREAK